MLDSSFVDKCKLCIYMNFFTKLKFRINLNISDEVSVWIRTDSKQKAVNKQ